MRIFEEHSRNGQEVHMIFRHNLNEAQYSTESNSCRTTHQESKAESIYKPSSSSSSSGNRITVKLTCQIMGIWSVSSATAIQSCQVMISVTIHDLSSREVLRALWLRGCSAFLNGDL